MTQAALPALITLLTLLLLFGCAVHVGRMRGKHRIMPPATHGHPEFERVYRVQVNTTESAAMFLPALWLAATYWSAHWAAALGALWLIGRLWHWAGYTRAAEKRGSGFGLSVLALLALLLGAAWGIVRTLAA
ncbi:MAG: MAPEG family protein [Burkholderiales bacterium]|jgi:uncharacterized membrane protein YecN with MAPEG domain|nr:MAPEG family protein [Burkholderiales bacterium]